jgi:phage antirepressor YoqD-like protein
MAGRRPTKEEQAQKLLEKKRLLNENKKIAMENKIFKYNKEEITFYLGDGSIMVNATEMAKSFNKRTNDWLRLDSTKDFLLTLALTNQYNFVDAGNPVTAIDQSLTFILERFYIDSKLVKIIQGGTYNKQGTWFHEDIALEFARWLSPDFGIWCNNRIKELIKFGMTATQPTLDQMINNPDLVIKLATQLKEERAAKVLAEIKIKELAPKAKVYDNIAECSNLKTISEVAKVLGTGQKRLFEILRGKKILMMNNLPYQEYIDRGYFKVKVKPIPSLDKDYSQTYVTPKGELWLSKLINQTE